jgi:hypothetical protein
MHKAQGSGFGIALEVTVHTGSCAIVIDGMPIKKRNTSSRTKLWRAAGRHQAGEASRSRHIQEQPLAPGAAVDDDDVAASDGSFDFAPDAVKQRRFGSHQVRGVSGMVRSRSNNNQLGRLEADASSGHFT